jgi:hypothetical protein
MARTGAPPKGVTPAQPKTDNIKDLGANIMAKGEFEVLNPPNKLKELFGGVTQIDEDLLAKAEEAAQKVIDTIDLAETTRPQLASLQTAIDEIAKGSEQAEQEKTIFTIMHDLRGQGANFGYPLVARIAASMNHYLESAGPGERDRSDNDVIRAHVDALRGVLANRLKGETGEIGVKIVSGLEAISGMKN